MNDTEWDKITKFFLVMAAALFLLLLLCNCIPLEIRESIEALHIGNIVIAEKYMPFIETEEDAQFLEDWLNLSKQLYERSR